MGKGGKVANEIQDNDKDDLSILSKNHNTSAEKQYASQGSHPEAKTQGRSGARPMSEGVHRTVC